MRQIAIGRARYRLVAVERNGQWLAHAEDADTGRAFGVACAGPTDDAAVDRLSRWLEWQAEHAAALEALQIAERAYHRTIAGGAFENSTGDLAAAELQAEALDAVDSARIRLDEIRTGRPDTN